MGLETEKGEKKFTFNALGREFQVFAAEDVVSVCDKIRSEAKNRLQRLKNGCEDEDVLEDVRTFLQKSISELCGDGPVSELEEWGCVTVPELTEVLCRAISELGREFVQGGDEVNE